MNRREYLYRRRNRAVGSLMGHLEREIFPHLAPAERVRLEQLVKSKIGSYHKDVLEALEDEPGTLYNPVSTRLQDKLRDSSHPR